MTKNIRNQNKNVKRKRERKDNEIKDEREQSPDAKHMNIADEENNIEDVQETS